MVSSNTFVSVCVVMRLVLRRIRLCDVPELFFTVFSVVLSVVELMLRHNMKRGCFRMKGCESMVV